LQVSISLFKAEKTMIEFVSGTLISKSPEHVVVLTSGGVGYGLDISLATHDTLPPRGENASLYTMVYMREDTFRLFGFATEDERDIFEVLIATSGIGPRLAMAILSHMPIGEFALAIATGDIARLITIPAIGKKTAERLCVELKGKLTNYEIRGRLSPSASPGREKSATEDAVTALVTLGVRPPVAALAIRKASESLGPEASVQDLIREGLKHRSGGLDI